MQDAIHRMTLRVFWAVAVFGAVPAGAAVVVGPTIALVRFGAAAWVWRKLGLQ